MMIGAHPADRAGPYADYALRPPAPGALDVWARGHIDGIFEDGRHGAVVFRRDEKCRVGAADALAKRGPLSRRRSIEILIIERQIANLHDLQLQRLRRKLDERM